MSKASDLIQRLEDETGHRVDENGFDNPTMAGLFGALMRQMGKTPSSYTERDDVAVGLLVRHQMTSEYQREQQSKRMMAELLMAGISPDDVVAIVGGSSKSSKSSKT